MKEMWGERGDERKKMTEVRVIIENNPAATGNENYYVDYN